MVWLSWDGWNGGGHVRVVLCSESMRFVVAGSMNKVELRALKALKAFMRASRGDLGMI